MRHIGPVGWVLLSWLILAAPCLSWAAGSHAAQPASRVLPYGPDDFCYRVNEPWLARTRLPDNRPYNSAYVEAYDALSAQLNGIVDSALQHPSESKQDSAIAALYQSYLDAHQAGHDGLARLQPYLEEAQRLHSPAELARLMVRATRDHRDLVGPTAGAVPAPLVITVWTDESNASRQAVHLAPSGMGLLDRSYYVSQDPRFAQIREHYLSVIEDVLQASGDKAASRDAAAAFRIESALARGQTGLAGQWDRASQSRRLSLQELQKIAPALDWETFYRELGLRPGEPLVSSEPDYLPVLSQVVAQSSHEDLAAYFRWQLLRRYGPFVNSRVAQRYFEFFDHELNGAAAEPPLRQGALELVQNVLPEELSAEYVRRYFPPSAKRQARALAENIRLAFRHRIETSWLQPQTRAAALHKLDKLVIQVGYPEGVAGDASLQLRGDDVIGNLVQVSERSFTKALARLRRPTDRAEWWTSAASTNTSYSTGTNALVVPAGALQPPEFDAKGPAAANYAGIGTKIGHEMGHGFDNLGSQYDADGNLRNWWTAADRREYARRAELLVQQYDRYEPMPGHHVNGRNTLPENLADLTGLELGYDGLRLARQSQGVPFSEEDRRLYFQSWAKLWRVQYTEPLLVRILNSDMHAPLQYRCIGPLSDFQPFYDVTHPSPGDPGYLAPAQRVTIW